MKKIRLFASIFLLLISWCNFNNNEKIFLSFEKAENIALENINYLANENNAFFQFKNYSAKCDIKSDDENMKLNTNISFSWFSDINKNKALDLYPNIYFFDKKKLSEISTTWLIQNIYYQNQYYTKLSWFSIDMWKWNYESNLRYMIINNLSDKRIKYNSNKFDNIKSTQNDIKFLLNTISSSNTFENIGQVTYEWDIAYKIAIKQDILNFIKNQTNIKISDFDWLFIIRSDNQVDLRINNMHINYENNPWNKDFTINWTIWEDGWTLNFSKNNEIIKILYETHRKYTKLTISKSINFNEIRNFTTNISKSQKDTQNRLNLKWNFWISPIVIYWSDLEKELEINIKCLYENFSWENLDSIIYDPDSYILLEQILWDEFSIKNFIWDK